MLQGSSIPDTVRCHRDRHFARAHVDRPASDHRRRCG